eukprot:TRINITY_DN6106_c0_g1_i7.p1 TRINITY_DN6106_c0_g1~~TRINITY_DN6106_c0_g1_i7.p1  ORF type:complete len:247 (-),score=27.33 TRINITY_DN6106_c0_g1_i7:296-928(-)
MVDGISLDQFVSCQLGPPNDTLDERKQLISGIGYGLKYLHSRQPCIVHGDLKPANILVIEGGAGTTDSELRPKIIDFGLSRVLTQHARPLGGSVRWMAPEVYFGRESPASSADVFSFGKVMFFIVTGIRPAACARRRVLPLDWPNENLLAGCFRPTVERCLDAVPGYRPSMCEIMTSEMLVIEETEFVDALEQIASAPSTAGRVNPLLKL